MVVFSSWQRVIALFILSLLLAIGGGRLMMKGEGIKAQKRLVNINTASLDEIASLPGIGKVLARRIIHYRMKYGPFSCKEELINVKGIGQKKLKLLMNIITTEDTKADLQDEKDCPSK